MSNTITPTAINSNLNNLSNRAMLASLEISVWSGRCTDKTLTTELIDQKQAEKETCTVTKKLIDKSALKEIKSIVNDARRIHKELTLAWTDKKARLIPTKFMNEHMSALRNLKSEFDDKVDIFLSNYDDLIKEAEHFLMDMYNPDDYPDSKTLKEKFKFDFLHEPLPDAADFRCEVDDNLKTELQERIQAATEQRVEVSMSKLWNRVYTVIQSMHEKLSVEDSVFHKTLVTNVQDLVALLPDLNITNNTKLASLTEQIQSELCGYEPEEIRKDQSIRKQVSDSSKRIMEEFYGTPTQSQSQQTDDQITA
ncbi:MAG: DUF3150 domain-containing protein [Candidatus Thorarchaeota archaeon]